MRPENVRPGTIRIVWVGIAGVFQPTVRFKQSGAQSTQLRPT